MIVSSLKMQALVLDNIHPSFILALKKMGISCNQQLEWSRSEVEKNIAAYEIIVVNSKTKVNKQLIDAAIKLKFICRPGSGMENIDLKYAKSKKIVCINSPEGNATAVAEHAMGMLLMWQHKIREANAEVINGKWLRKENTGSELSGKTIGIIGYGHTGESFAKRCAAMEMRVLAYDKYKKKFGSKKIIESSLQKIFMEADVISFHLPLTAETKHFGDEVFFKKLKKKILLINTSRGEVINTKHLYAELQQNKIVGACLDVLENENIKTWNLAEKKIAKMPQVLITPHIAGWTHEAKFKMAKVLLKKLKKNLKIN